MRRTYWTHLPAAGLWVGFAIWFLSRVSELPNRVPLNIDWSGEVTRWGSPWFAFGLVAGLGLFFMGLTVLLDELWAQQETQKRFNYLSLLDELVLSLMVSIQYALLVGAANGATVYHFPWIYALLMGGGAILLGIWIERKRPVRASTDGRALTSVASDAFRNNLRERVEKDKTVVFWDIQNPKYVSWLSIGVPLLLWLSAVLVSSESGWAALLNTSIGLLLLLFYGGQRTCVSRDGIILRYGLMGIPLFRCHLSEIAGVRIRSFAPLADFGGYGIRMRKGVTAYYLAGRTGVQLELINRRSVLIGSSNPEQLGVVIEALTDKALTNESEEEI